MSAHERHSPAAAIPERAPNSIGSTASIVTSQIQLLHEPVLIVMLTGWIDATGAAAAAVDQLSRACQCDTSPIARSTTTHSSIIGPGARRWSSATASTPTCDGTTSSSSPVARPTGGTCSFLMGPEPDMNWRRFSKAIGDIAVELGVTHMIGFGAYPFAAPHTRTPRLSCSSPSIDVLANVTFARSSVDVPAGMAAALEHTMHDRKIPALGIWAQVPHYVSSMTYPASSVALLDGLAEATGVRIAGAALRNEVDVFSVNGSTRWSPTTSTTS